MNIVCLLVLQLATNTWAHVYFKLGSFPSWAGGDGDVSVQLVNATTTAWSYVFSHS